MSEHILVVENDQGIADTVRRGLIFEGYRVTVVYDGPAALASARDEMPDLVVLDWMLPGLDGLEVCKRLRAASQLPVLMLTAKDSIPERVEGLDASADDYLVKPFACDELLARVRALLRRAKPVQAEVLRFGDLELDTGIRQARRGGTTIELTAKEYELLDLFMHNPRIVLTRELIFDRIWGCDFGSESNIIEVYVRYLRRKIEAGGLPRLICTVRGVGYVLRAD